MSTSKYYVVNVFWKRNISRNEHQSILLNLFRNRSRNEHLSILLNIYRNWFEGEALYCKTIYLTCLPLGGLCVGERGGERGEGEGKGRGWGRWKGEGEEGPLLLLTCNALNCI